MTAPTLQPQRMLDAITFGHCALCGTTSFLVTLPQRRAGDLPVPLCGTCLEQRQEKRERRRVARAVAR